MLLVSSRYLITDLLTQSMRRLTKPINVRFCSSGTTAMLAKQSARTPLCGPCRSRPLAYYRESSYSPHCLTSQYCYDNVDQISCLKFSRCISDSKHFRLASVDHARSEYQPLATLEELCWSIHLM